MMQQRASLRNIITAKIFGRITLGKSLEFTFQVRKVSVDDAELFGRIAIDRP